LIFWESFQAGLGWAAGAAAAIAVALVILGLAAEAGKLIRLRRELRSKQ